MVLDSSKKPTSDAQKLLIHEIVSNMLDVFDYDQTSELLIKLLEPCTDSFKKDLRIHFSDKWKTDFR
jgi:hypothetical protein